MCYHTTDKIHFLLSIKTLEHWTCCFQSTFYLRHDDLLELNPFSYKSGYSTESVLMTAMEKLNSDGLHKKFHLVPTECQAGAKSPISLLSKKALYVTLANQLNLMLTLDHIQWWVTHITISWHWYTVMSCSFIILCTQLPVWVWK